MIFRSLFETTFSAGSFSSSESDNAKLSPTQLNSGLSDVFSKGSIISVSVARCGWAKITAEAITIKAITAADFFSIWILKTKNSPVFQANWLTILMQTQS